MEIFIILLIIPLIMWIFKPIYKNTSGVSLIKDNDIDLENRTALEMAHGLYGDELLWFRNHIKLNEEKENDEVMKVELTNPKFDISKIKEYIPDNTIKNTRFIPNAWGEYIGQENAKKNIQEFIRGSKEINAVFPHFILDGNAGFGKTTLIHLLKKYLDAEMIEHIASELTNIEQLIPILNKINSSASKNIILFIDEVHNLNPQLIEILYPILQIGKIDNKLIKPFTFVGATTEKGQLIGKWKPFVDRMELQITLQNYNLEEIKRIIKQYKDKIFPNIKITDDIYTILAKNSRLTPRKAERMVNL